MGGSSLLTPALFNVLMQQITSLQALESGSEKDMSPITSHCSCHTKANNLHGVHADTEHQNGGLAAHVHPLNINCFSDPTQACTKNIYRQNVIYIYSIQPTHMRACAQTHPSVHTLIYTQAH